MGSIGVFLGSGSVFKCAGNRTDSEAETASCAIGCNDWFVGVSVKGDGLVSGIEAGHIAFSAVDAEIILDDWEFLLFRHMVDIFKVM